MEFLKRFWYEWRWFFVFIAVMLVFRSAIADWNQVPSGSMEPSILTGDRLVVDKIAYDLRVPFSLQRIIRWADPARGDIVTFPNPITDDLYVKRVVGIPGDVVELRRSFLVVNGVAATYNTIDAASAARLPLANLRVRNVLREEVLGSERIVQFLAYRQRRESNFGPVTVPAGQYLVMGDNRDNSKDYREFGFVSRERILGRAHAVAFSLDYENFYWPRFNRFFRDLL